MSFYFAEVAVQTVQEVQRIFRDEVLVLRGREPDLISN